MENQKIEKTIQAFAQGADQQDADQVSSALHPQAQQYFTNEQGLNVLPTPKYVELLREKKIGGNPREVKIHQIDVTGDIASAKVRFSGEKASFENYMTLMKFGEDWKILSNVLSVTRD